MRHKKLTERLVAEGMRQVDALGGLRASLDHLSYEEIIKEAGVARSSAYNAYSRDAFFELLTLNLVAPQDDDGLFARETIDEVQALITSRFDELGTPEGRRGLMEEAVRFGAMLNFETIRRSGRWRSIVALEVSASMPTDKADPDAAARLHDALVRGEQEFLHSLAEFYADMGTLLGLRLRAPYTSFEQLAAAGSAVLEGLAIRADLCPEIVLAEDDDGWPFVARCFLAVLDEFVEIDTAADYEPSRALTAYVQRRLGRAGPSRNGAGSPASGPGSDSAGSGTALGAGTNPDSSS